MATVLYYASIVDYTSGTVVWSLNWVPTSAGIAPYIDNTGLPQEQVGIVFTDPVTGGAPGTATVSATVNGVPIQANITAVVDEVEICCWVQSEILPSTINLFHFNGADGSSVLDDSADVGRTITADPNFYQVANPNNFCGNSLLLGLDDFAIGPELSPTYPTLLSGMTFDFSVFITGTPSVVLANVMSIDATTGTGDPLQISLTYTASPGNIPQLSFNDNFSEVSYQTWMPIGEWVVFSVQISIISPTSVQVQIFKNGNNLYDITTGYYQVSATPAVFRLGGGSGLLFDEYRFSNEAIYPAWSHDTYFDTVECTPITCEYVQSKIDQCTMNLWHFDNNANGNAYDELSYLNETLSGDVTLSSAFTFCGDSLYTGTNNTQFTLAPNEETKFSGGLAGVTYEFALYVQENTLGPSDLDFFRADLLEYANGEGIATLFGILYDDGLIPKLKLVEGFSNVITEIPLVPDAWNIIAIEADRSSQTFSVYHNGIRVLDAFLYDYFNYNQDDFGIMGGFTIFTGQSVYFDEFRRSKVRRYTGASYSVTGESTCVPGPLAPYANFDTVSVDRSGFAPFTVDFLDTSENSPTSWLWDFGDGNTSTLQNPSHTYEDPPVPSGGYYDVSLEATNAYGTGILSRANYIYVAPPAISPSYTWNPASGTYTGGTLNSPDNNRFTWTTYGAAAVVHGRSVTAISGKTYCEFRSLNGPGNMYTGFGVVDGTSNVFFSLNANSGAMFTRKVGFGGCGLPVAGFYNGAALTTNLSYSFTTQVIGIAFDPATRRVWFSLNGVWISGDPSTDTSPTMTLAGGTNFYFSFSAYSCNVSPAVTQFFDISPNLGSQFYPLPTGYTRYQP